VALSCSFIIMEAFGEVEGIDVFWYQPQNVDRQYLLYLPYWWREEVDPETDAEIEAILAK
jgi:hypothetical protein